MKKNYFAITYFFIFTMALMLNGCIVFHKISYEVQLETPTSGIAVVTAYDMRTDAKTKSELDIDKRNLFQFMLKSKEFVKEQGERGKFITGRRLYIEDGILNGQGTYKFTDISAVEAIKYEDGFHYLNLGVDDSVLSTNGEIVRSKDYKRIMWDSTFKELNFTMFSNDLQGSQYKPLAQYYESKKK